MVFSIILTIKNKGCKPKNLLLS